MTGAGAPGEPALGATLIKDTRELLALERPWRDSAVADGNLFVTPDWYFEALAAFPSLRPAVVAVRRAEEVVGLIPLVDDGHSLRFPAAALGDRFSPVVLDPEVVDKGAVWRRAAPLLSRLAISRLIVLGRIECSPVARVPKTFMFTEGHELLPFVSLHDMTWDRWLRERSGNFRSEIARKRRRLERAAVVGFTQAQRVSETEGALRAHFDLHFQRRDALRDVSSLAPLDAQRFHFALARRLAAHGWLRMWFLENDGVPIASWYGWSIGGRYAYYQAGFDPRWSAYSPGTLLMVETIRAALTEGASEYDLLLGDERYKQRFATSARRVTSVIVGRPTSPPFLKVCGGIAVRRVYRVLPQRVRTATRQSTERLRSRRTTI